MGRRRSRIIYNDSSIVTSINPAVIFQLIIVNCCIIHRQTVNSKLQHTLIIIKHFQPAPIIVRVDIPLHIPFVIGSVWLHHIKVFTCLCILLHNRRFRCLLCIRQINITLTTAPVACAAHYGCHRQNIQNTFSISFPKISHEMSFHANFLYFLLYMPYTI